MEISANMAARKKQETESTGFDRKGMLFNWV